MKLNNTMLIGAGAGVVGLLLGLAIGASGRSELAARADRQAELTAGVQGLTETVGGVETQVGELGGRIDGIEAALAELGQTHAGQIEELGQTHAGQIEGLTQRVEGIGASLGGAMSEVGSSVSEALSGDLEDLRSQVASLAERAVARVEEATATTPPMAGTGEPVEIARTVVFGDGAARVYLSAADRVRGTARVAVNGSEVTTLTLGQAVEAGDCRLTLTGFVESGATIAGDCGAVAASGSGEGTEVEVAGMADLADGKLRVFLSGIDAEAGTARVAINGTKTTLLTMSQPVEAGDCSVTLTGLGAGSAMIDGRC